MLTEPTVEKLQSLKLDVLAQAWLAQQRNADLVQLGFDERFALLVDAQFLAQQNKRLDRALKEARLKLGSACIEDIDYPAPRGLDRAQIRQMATCRWVVEHLNCVITGPTGVGKTYIGCALAQQACRKGYGTRSTVVTSQLPTDKWHEHLGDPTLADAICDRLLHNAHRIVLKGPSRRKEKLAGENTND